MVQQHKKMINMKRFLFWLARIFNVDLTVEKIVYRDKIKEVIIEKQISLDGVIDGDVTVKGDLVVKGSLSGDGITCYKKGE